LPAEIAYAAGVSRDLTGLHDGALEMEQQTVQIDRHDGGGADRGERATIAQPA
jgi:hypothetical protein